MGADEAGGPGHEHHSASKVRHSDLRTHRRRHASGLATAQAFTTLDLAAR
jgi:hypothetical protein